jgi:hypothetical protein
MQTADSRKQGVAFLYIILAGEGSYESCFTHAIAYIRKICSQQLTLFVGVVWCGVVWVGGWVGGVDVLGVCFASTLFIASFVPETKGKAFLQLSVCSTLIVRLPIVYSISSKIVHNTFHIYLF